MAKYDKAEALSNLTLGKTTEYNEVYDPSLLQAVPRSLNRDDLAIDQINLPFKGQDIWYGYELSWLNNQGLPQVALAEFTFDAASPNIVESKSFKLYLNSFNQTKFKNWSEVQTYLEHDLANTSGETVIVKLFPVDNCPKLETITALATCIDQLDIAISEYEYNPELLAGIQAAKGEAPVEEKIVSHLLKSNCLITNQPDWASLYIHYKGLPVNQEKLLRYIVSFRQHNEFHEQCVERIYTDLMKYGQFEELTIFARYTRRGGLDINPLRSNCSTTMPNCRTLRQ